MIPCAAENMVRAISTNSAGSRFVKSRESGEYISANAAMTISRISLGNGRSFSIRCSNSDRSRFVCSESEVEITSRQAVKLGARVIAGDRA